MHKKSQRLPLFSSDPPLFAAWPNRSTLATAISLALASTTAAKAQQPADATAQQLPKVSVQAETEEGYKADQVSSPKFTQPLLDTPQTVTVINKEIIAEQGALSLSETLRNTPGITFQLGENGNTQSGDTIFMRGFDTQNSIYIDGIRDLNPAVRDVFNIEQIEIFKGPAGADNGRGATSGYVNLVSKLPLADEFNSSSLSYGSEDRRRVTTDVNHHFDSDAGIAVRLNAMGQDGGVAGRDFIERQSFGIAPSLAVGLGTPTRLYAFGQYVRQDNTPDGAVPTLGVADYVLPILASNGIDPARVAEENFYGLDDDFEDITAGVLTVRLEHDFTPNLTVRNTSRYSKAEQERILTAPIVSTTSPLVVSDDPDGAGPLPPVIRAPGAWTVSRSRHASYRENELLTNQTNLTTGFATGAIDHTLSGGVEFIREKQFTPAYVELGTPLVANLYNPDPADDFTVAPAIARNGVFSDGKTTTTALYAFDTLNLNARWQLNAGLRAEHYKTETQSAVLSTAATYPSLPVGTLVPSAETVSDNLFSWKIGAVFKPVPNGSLYVGYANSLKPPGGDNFALVSQTTEVGGNANINNPSLDPQKAINIEAGTKWDLLDGRLAATAAVFRSENEKELARTDPGDPDLVIQYGKKRVEGVELGLVGQITPLWQVSAGITRQDTEVKEGSSSATVVQTGAAINFSPKLSATLWTTYKLPFGLALGGGARYVDTQARQINTLATPGSVFEVPSYTVFDAYASYDLTDAVLVQLNAYNLTDEFYVGSINNSGQRYVAGTPRSYLLTVNFSF